MAKAKKKESTLTLEEKLAQALVPESEQPYKVPKNWCWTRLSCVAKWGSGGTPSRKHPEFYNGDILWVKTGELNNNYIYNTEEKITEEAIVNSSAKLFPKDTIVIAMYGATIGKVAVLGVPATTNQACACGICSDGLYNKFLFYYAIQQKETFINLGKGGAQPNISQEIIKKHIIALPPLAEQRRIVERIEALFDKLDEAKEKLQEVLDGFETRKAAILHKAFTGELTAKWREENGVDSEWLVCEVRDVFEMQAGKNISASKISKKMDEKNFYPCFGGNGIRGYVEYFNREGNHPIIGRQGALCGNVNLASGKFYATEHAVVVSFKQKIDIVWAEHYLRFLNFNQYATSTAQPGLAVSNLMKVSINVPLYEEQIEIGKIIVETFTREERVKVIAEERLEQIETMKKAILARAFRGELGTDDENDEYAVELLKRVL